jgi:signal transduction histidine kinase
MLSGVPARALGTRWFAGQAGRTRAAVLAGGGIANRLTFAIILFSMLVTFLTTATQLVIEYNLDLRGIHERFSEIRTSQLPILTNSVWILDDALIRTQLDGLARLPDIERLSVEVNGQTKWSSGASRADHPLSDRMPLIQQNRDKAIEIGVLEVTASLDNVYRRLMDKALSALLENAIKTAAIAGFALVLFQLTVTRHLHRMAAYAQRLDIADDDAPDLQLERTRRRRGDVLDQLVRSINTMRANLSKAYATSKRDEERIRRENQHLADLLRDDTLRGVQVVDVFQTVTETLVTGLNVSRATAWRLDEARNELQCLDSFEPDGLRHAALAGWAAGALPEYLSLIHREKVIAISDIWHDPRGRELLVMHGMAPPYRSVIGVALQIDGKLGGLLSIQHQGEPREWTADEVGFAGAVGAVASAAIEARDKRIAQHELSQYRDHLEEIIATRTAELTDANVELNRTLDVLKTTQAELLDQEKFASLGTIVAGVAHEVNTPIGVGVTASSALKQATVRLQKKVEAGELKKSDLMSYIEVAARSADILEANLGRAAELVRSFKQVAVDQSSEAVRVVELGQYVHDVMTSLRPELRKAGHAVTVDAPRPLQLETTPSAIWQIVSNLVMNSILHAFEPAQHGHLTISVTEAEDAAILVYRDDGKGMNPDVRRRIFEPFFTTKRGQGGSGLGLSIVYNLVTKTLGGTILCTSAPDVGTEFMITIPMRSSERGDA